MTQHVWRSIDETEPAEKEVVVLRGIPATVPLSYERFYCSRRVLTVGFVALCLQRLTAWSAALAAHVLLAVLLLAVYYEVVRQDESPVWASLHRGKAGDEGKLPEAPKPETPKEEEKPPEPEPPQPEPPKPEPVKPAPAPVEEPKPSPNPVAGPAPAEAKPATVGASASAAGAPARPEVSDREVEKDPTEAIRRRRAGELGQLRGGTRQDVVVVAGCYDRVQDVLEKLDVPHTVIDYDRLPRYNLAQCKVLLVNCDNRYASWIGRAAGDVRALQRELEKLEEMEADLRRRIDGTKEKQTVYRLNLLLLDASSQIAAVRRQIEMGAGATRVIDMMREHVEDGGYLFTSDWGLTIVERAFPGYLKNAGNVGPKTVAIRAKQGKERHPLLEEVFYSGGKSGASAVERKFLWEIDSASYYVKPEKPGVETLVESLQLGRYPAVAATFVPEGGRGRVLHVLSHFQKQATKQGDFALQNLLLNFMFERVSRGGKPAAFLPPAPVAVEEPAAPRPAEPSFKSIHRDEKRGISIPVPVGWTARTGKDETVALEMMKDDGSGANFGLAVAGPEESLLNANPDWAPFVKGLTRSLSADYVDVVSSRRAQAFCCGHPAMLVVWSVTAAGRKLSLFQYLVATPQAFYTLSWIAPADQYRELEPVFEKASRAFTVPRR